MAARDRWRFQQGILWSAELDELSADPLSARLPAEYGVVARDSFERNIDSSLLRAVRQMDPIAPAAIDKRFALGSQCFVARVDEDVVAYGWLTRGPEWIGEFERELRVEVGEAYIWDCATLPAFRRQRLFSALLGYIVGQARLADLHRLWIVSLRVSPALAQGMAAAGFAPLLALSYLRLLNRHLLLATPQAGATAAQLAAARRLLRKENETTAGRLFTGNSSHPPPPATHYDGI